MGRLQRLSEEEAQLVGVHYNPFGVIPKKSSPNKWRLILDFSFPHGKSVNDGVSKDLSSLNYVSVDEIVSHILQLGQGAVMAKMDIKQAYRNIPVHPDDRYLLGMYWEGHAYVDKTFPFGLRSAPLIFTVVADALQWVMERQGVSWVRHYMDDFITVGAPGASECMRNIQAMQATCEAANMPVEPEKNEGPATVISFLGSGTRLDQAGNQTPKGQASTSAITDRELEGKESSKEEGTALYSGSSDTR